MNLWRKLLFPIVPIYYLATFLRNQLYDFNAVSSKSYSVPVICVGNLSVGGTGKTPMIEYLIRLLSTKRIATLSRGYKRHTKGFVLAQEDTKIHEIGDEPYQFKKKFKDILVAVDENRQRGIQSLMQLDCSPEIILLDDAFQHRKVRADLNILLTAYNHLYADDCLLPTGDLREPKSGAKRADMVVVTKCPENLSDLEKQQVKIRLKITEFQKVFFSHIVYNDFVWNDLKTIPLNDLKERPFTLVTGIANAKPLVDFLNRRELQFEHLNFKDHHEFSNSELKKLREKHLIITTEKDFVRLNDKIDQSSLFYLPIRMVIDKAEAFKQELMSCLH